MPRSRMQTGLHADAAGRGCKPGPGRRRFLGAAMDTHTLKISRPCPIDLDVDRDSRQFFCDHCQKDVHVLGNWPRAEAEAFIAANRGRSVCVSLRRDRQGELLYADSPARTRPAELVPVARLRRRWLPEAAAAAGVAAALSACTPHGPVRGVDIDGDELVSVRTPAGGVTVPDQVAAPDEGEEMMLGEIAAPEPRIERGEKPAIQPPPAPKKAPKPKPAKETPKPSEWDTIAGGVDF